MTDYTQTFRTHNGKLLPELEQSEFVEFLKDRHRMLHGSNKDGIVQCPEGAVLAMKRAK